MLVSFLLSAGLLEQARSMGLLTPGCDAIVRMIQCNINSPLTSSAGRLFDAIACLLGACRVQTYDGEAAMRLEALAAPDEQGLLPFAVSDTVVDCALLFEALLEGLARSTPANLLAGRFHNTLAEIIVACGERLAERGGDLPWVFSGGVFQNRLLVAKLLRHRRARRHRLCFPAYPNDSGIALGQAAIGIARIQAGCTPSALPPGAYPV
jgi:hydrogenase maturation protein HypF